MPSKKIKAQSHLDIALQKMPKMSRVFADKLASRQEKNYEEQMIILKKSLNLRPDDAHALQGLGIAYRELGRNEEAIEAYKESLEYRPDDAATLNNLASVYNDSGQNEEAIEAYKKSLELRAITIDSKNREDAKEDSDFLNISNDPRFLKLVNG